MHLPQSHHHPDPLRTLAPHLLRHLPYSLPILRIIQHTASNPDARVFSTFTTSDDNADPRQQRWAAVYVERSRFPDTECWLFSTFETWVLTRRHHRGGSSEQQDGMMMMVEGTEQQRRRRKEEEGEEARMHLLSVLNDVAAHSASLLQLGVKSQTLPTLNTPLILGSLSDPLLPLLSGTDLPFLKPVALLSREILNVAVDGRAPQDGTLSPLAPSSSTTTTDDGGGGGGGGVVLAYCHPIHKFLIPPPPPSQSPPASLLPDAHYTFTTTPLLNNTQDLQLAVSRSTIPRTVASLAKLGGVAVRFGPDPSPGPSPSPTALPTGGGRGGEEGGGGRGGQQQLISWLFLSPDGSLQSLHVEREHRGRGVAKAVCRRLMERLRDEPEGVGIRPLGRLQQLREGSDDGHGMVTVGEEGLGGDDDVIATAMREVGAEGWAHSDVLEHNKDGAGVARAIGGKAGWRVRWVGVDLERVKRLCASMSA